MRILKILTLAIGLCTVSAALADDFTLTIARKYSDANCTSGYLAVNGTIQAYTLERPWAGNAPLLSSIPVGTYNGILRYDHSDQWRIELQGVPGRTQRHRSIRAIRRTTQKAASSLARNSTAVSVRLRGVPASPPMTPSRLRSTVQRARYQLLTRPSP